MSGLPNLVSSKGNTMSVEFEDRHRSVDKLCADNLLLEENNLTVCENQLVPEEGEFSYPGGK